MSGLWRRFDFGRVGLAQPPQDRSLDEFERPDGVRFRIKVVAESEHRGCLLGEADQIRPLLYNEEDAPPLPLIDVEAANLGGEIWRVWFPDQPNERVTLQISDRIEDHRGRARDPLFCALVLPSVLREILTRILVVTSYQFDDESESDDDSNADMEDWRERWLAFVTTRLPNVGNPPPLPRGDGGVKDLDSPDWVDVLDWINRSASAFAEQREMLGAMIRHWA
jgi:hypothetical protein